MITACLIVRNEARVLGRCLRSIAPFVDACCVLDSGSDDGTVEIAQAAGARVVVDRSLADSRGRLRHFAQARNAALSMVPEGWVLSIDADETLTLVAPARLRRLVARPKLQAIELPISSGGIRWHLPRLFRKMPWTCWHERVHEWLEVRGQIARTDAALIENFPDKGGKESAVQRDLRLCRRQLREDPRNLRAVMYLARALRHATRYAEAIPLYVRYCRESDFGAGRYTAAIGAAICSLLRHDYAAARQFALTAHRLDPRLAEACCVLGDAYLGAGRVDLAQAWFERALHRAMPGMDYPLFIDPSSYGTYPRERLRWIDEARRSASGGGA